MKVAVIDSGASNLNSVYQALKRCECVSDIKITFDKAELDAADKLIFPGVGAISAVMRGLEEHDLKDYVISTKKPVLGICLGMQILFEKSEELPLGAAEPYFCGLGIMEGTVAKLKSGSLPLPHMGWNSLSFGDHPLFKGLNNGAFVYFVHSYRAPVSKYTIASCEYGETFSAAVCRDNFLGVQFHPEKSGPLGHQILMNYLEL